MFLKFLKYLDEKLNQGREDRIQPKSLLKIELLFYHIIILTIFVYDAYVWCTNYKWIIFRFCLFRYINFYHCIITMLVVLHFASALSGRYKRINKLLVKSNDLHNIINSFIPKGNTKQINNLKSIKEVTDYYLLLSEMVDMFNRLFGWQIFLVTENIIFLLLDVANSFMVSLDHSQKFSEGNDEIGTIVLLISISVMMIIFHSRVVLHCEDVNRESRQTLTICYNLQQTVEPDSEERKELIILSDVVNLLKTRTNAAGFYYVDRGLLSRVFAYIFSYSIVLVQFNKQPI
ncbi:hypothetical protein JTB14_005511 [Gonioctena quinquepunctata]|nr:hypothetical protein JTB14_005511 [Gonioctena quinquepunctata]